MSPKFVIDTDVGIDDAVALLMVLAHPRAQLEAITTVVGNVPLKQATHNAGVILDLVRAGPIPLYQGCDRPLLRHKPLDAADIQGDDGLGGASPQVNSRQTEPEHASLALIDLARQQPGQLTLLTLGPLTNIAVAIRLEPNFLKQFNRVVVMGGSVDGRGNTTSSAEFNIMVDPEAAAILFSASRRCGVELELVSWEATLAHPTPLVEWQAMIKGTTAVAQFLQKVTAHIARVWSYGDVLWPDPLAAAVALEPDIVQEQTARFVAVDHSHGPARGATIVDYRLNSPQAPNAKIIRTVDVRRFQTLLRKAVQI